MISNSKRMPAFTVRNGLRAAVLVVATGLSAGLATAQMGGQDGGQNPPMAMGGRMVRGTVTAATADHLTLKTEQGDVYDVVVTPNTQVRRGRDPIKLADVHAGDGVGAMGEIDPAKKTVHALMVMVIDAERMKKAREAMGKTYIAGTVTAIDDLKITVLRTDKVTQVIQVDEDTSFRKGGRSMQMVLGDTSGIVMGGGGGLRQGAAGAGGAAPAQQTDGGEAITLADVKVGNVIAGTGALKNGVFVPTQLGVSDPAAQRQRRRPDAAAGTTPPTGTATEPK